MPPVYVVSPGTVRSGASRPGRIPRLESEAAALLPGEVANPCAATRFIPTRNTFSISGLKICVSLMDAVLRHRLLSAKIEFNPSGVCVCPLSVDQESASLSFDEGE